MKTLDDEGEGIALIVAGCKMMGWVIAVPRGVDDVQYMIIGEEQIVGRVDKILSRQIRTESVDSESKPEVPS